MKEGIHPNYEQTTIKCACGNVIETGSTKKDIRVEVCSIADLVMPSVALAQGFGRIGCFLAGCCYGMPTHSHFAIVFHDSDFAPNNIPLVPTQLISSGLDFLHCLLLLYAAKKCKKQGQVVSLYLICYSLGRFVLEFFRGDLNRGAVGSLSTSQFISLFIFAAGVAMFAFCGKRTEVPLEK